MKSFKISPSSFVLKTVLPVKLKALTGSKACMGAALNVSPADSRTNPKTTLRQRESIYFRSLSDSASKDNS